MKHIWNVLNQKKTIIGAGLFLAALIIQNLLHIWFEPAVPDWGPKLVETLELFGGIFSGVGLGHKGVKMMQAKTG